MRGYLAGLIAALLFFANSARAASFAPLGALARRLRWLGVVGRIGVVFRQSRDEPAGGERLQVCLKRVGNLLGIDFLILHIEREGPDVLFLLRRIFDRCLCPRKEWIVFNAARFRLRNIVREGVKLAFGEGAMFGKDIDQRRQRRIALLTAQRFRRGGILDVEPDLILPFGHRASHSCAAPDPSARSDSARKLVHSLAVMSPNRRSETIRLSRSRGQWVETMSMKRPGRADIRPMRSDSMVASSSACVIKTIVAPVSRQMRSNSSPMSRRVCWSSAAKGSSSNM